MFVTILSIALVALSPSGLAPSSAPVLLGGGGPDAFGYQYLDSDTTAPGAPVYNWVSIKGIGTQITGLGDDNHAGPFAIGFEFPYYWYNVNSVMVGSNGYVTFGDGSSNASPFHAVPNTQKPNNQLAPLLSDLDCTDTLPGTVWYWSNNSDSFIVEYDSVAFWSTGGNNTFQIILTKADSSVTFQYKEQSGSPYNGWGTENNQTGIENISGAIGLNYLSGTAPANNALHSDLAVRFFPPESTTLQIHDVGVRNAMNDRNGGVFAMRDRPLSFWAVVRNYGNQAEGAYKTYFKVQRVSGAVLYSDSVDASASDPAQAESLAPAGAWRPSTNGVYIIRVITKLTGDMLASDDTAAVELNVVTMPALLSYDNGSPDSTMYWNGPGGFGNHFVPPVYPCSVASARVYMAMQATPSTPRVGVYDDNGQNGGPGDVLYETTVTVDNTAAEWFTITPPSPIVIDSGAFFVCASSDVSTEPVFGMDVSAPHSLQGWEYTGVWSPSRDAAARDVGANATISGPVGIEESFVPADPSAPVRIDVNPNPFGGMATIRLLNPTGLEKAIELYDATGSIVRRLDLNRAQATLDGRHLAGGVYFTRVVGTEVPVAKVIVTH